MNWMIRNCYLDFLLFGMRLVRISNILYHTIKGDDDPFPMSHEAEGPFLRQYSIAKDKQ
jgi:hypothetical protein